MTELTITVEDNPEFKDIQAVIGNILDYNNNSQNQKDIAYPLAVLIRDATGEIVGGLVGKTHWGRICGFWMPCEVRDMDEN